MRYDYRKALMSDIKAYIRENGFENKGYYELYDLLWVEDSVTGNGSGSYTFNRCQAKEYLKGNLMIELEDALNEFGCGIDIIGNDFDTCKVSVGNGLFYLNREDCDLYGLSPVVDIWDKGAEWCDVVIRCNLLGECLDKVLTNKNF
jgi:hypothetical protein